jgi:hypothetical protein
MTTVPCNDDGPDIDDDPRNNGADNSNHNDGDPGPDGNNHRYATYYYSSSITCIK